MNPSLLRRPHGAGHRHRAASAAVATTLAPRHHVAPYGTTAPTRPATGCAPWAGARGYAATCTSARRRRLIDDAVKGWDASTAGQQRRHHPPRPAADTADEDWDLVLTSIVQRVPHVPPGRPAHDRARRGRSSTSPAAVLQGGLTVRLRRSGGWPSSPGAGQRMGVEGVNVNAIAPGYIGPQHQPAARDRPAALRSGTHPGRPLGRAKIWGAAVFLCSRASDFVHGHILVVDGGWLGR
jgi:hypothetical protein